MTRVTRGLRTDLEIVGHKFLSQLPAELGSSGLAVSEENVSPDTSGYLLAPADFQRM